MKNLINYSNLDKRTVISIGLVGLLTCFFSTYLFLIFLLILITSIILLRIFPGKFDNKLRLLFTNSAIILVSVYVICLCGESYLRFVQPKFLNLEITTLGDFSDFTKRGYLDKSIFKKPQGIFRILGFGDSFARNMAEKEKNYHNFLEADFLKKGTRRIQIINAGMSGIGPGYYWHILKKYGDAIKPDLVIVGVFVGNDFEELEFKYVTMGTIGIKEYLEPGEKILRFFRFPDWWLYQLIRRNLILMREQRKKAYEVKNQLVKEEATFSNTAFYDIQKKRMWIFEKENQERLRKIFAKGSKVFLNFKTWCQDRNLELVIAIFPDQFQVDNEMKNMILAKYGMVPDSLDVSFPDQLLVQFCQRNNIHCLDMLADFQKQAQSAKLYRLNDTHWNEAGNRLAADLIFHYLQQNRLALAN